MGTTFSYRSGEQARPADVSQIPLLIGCCEDGTPGTTYTLDPGDDVAAVLGPGRLAAMVLAHHANAGTRVVACPATPTYPALPSVTQSGTGPAITVANLGSGANDSAALRLKVTSDATAFDVSYDGTTYVETIPIPSAGPAVVRGSVELGALSLATINGTTLVFSAPSSTTITFGSAPTSVQDVADDFNTLAISGTLAVRARIAETSAGSYLELYSTATGTSAGITIDATSTGETVLGLSTTAAAGTAATRSIEWLGIRLTCAAGTYVADEVYSIALTGPRASVSAYTSALSAALGSYAAKPFGYVAICEDVATNATARTLYDSLRAIVAAKRVDSDDPILVDVVTPTALHTASATRATNDSAIVTFDADLLAAFSGATASLENVAADDCYVSGPPKMPGTFRRPATWAAAMKRSKLDRIGGNPCDGYAVGVSLRAADGATYARDEARASTKLGGLAGAGFWALKSMADGGTKFAPSASRAGSLDRYRNPGVVAIALAMSRAILPQLQAWEGTWETDEDNPLAVSPSQAEHREGVLEALIEPLAFPDGKPKNVTAFTVKLAGATILDDGRVAARLRFNPLAVAEWISVDVIATGAVLVAEEG